MKHTIKKLATSPWTALVTLALVLAIRIADPGFVESVRLRYFDTLITSRAPTQNNIYTVNIDEAALDRYGQWPFKRDVYAGIIRELYKRNAGLVVFNVLMPEQDRLGGDAQLAQTLRQYPTVLANVPAQKTKNTPRVPGSAVLNPEYLDRIVQYPGIIANIPQLEQSAVGVGTTNTLPEVDGVNRRLPLVVSVGDRLYPSLTMETLRVAAGDTTFQVKLNENGVEKMRIPKFGPIATDSLGRIWIDYSQQNHSVSVTQLPDDFGGSVVIVGVAAAGLSNPLPTPLGAQWPQDVQAAVLGTMFNGVTIQRPDWADGAEMLALVALTIILIFLSRWTYVGLSSVVVSVVGVVLVSKYLYSSSLWLTDATLLAGGLLLVALHVYGVKFVSEFLQKQQIKRQFGTYLSPALVAKLQKNPELLQLGGDERELSIMFTDVRGFTSISEHYGRNVQGLTKIMNRYMTAMTAKIIENNGTLDKYIGDAQMAFWNAPLDEPRHAHQAVRTALQMLGSLDAFNREVAAEGVPPFGMGLGINTAAVVVGNMGSDQRFDYTCLGDGVNLASRLEGQSKPYGVRIVLGERTARLVENEYFTLELDSIAVKGKQEGVNIFTVLDAAESKKLRWESDRRLHNQALEYYRRQEWQRAEGALHGLLGSQSFAGEMDNYYSMMLDRIEELRRAKLPRDWDGIFRATSK